MHVVFMTQLDTITSKAVPRKDDYGKLAPSGEPDSGSDIGDHRQYHCVRGASDTRRRGVKESCNTPCLAWCPSSLPGQCPPRRGGCHTGADALPARENLPLES